VTKKQKLAKARKVLKDVEDKWRLKKTLEYREYDDHGNTSYSAMEMLVEMGRYTLTYNDSLQQADLKHDLTWNAWHAGCGNIDAARKWAEEIILGERKKGK
jgi:hypothetical protein